MEKTSDYKWFWDGLDHYLIKNGMKQSSQRKVIVSYFLEVGTHVHAEDIHAAMRADGHVVGLATIYRALSLLKDAGLVQQYLFGDGKRVFEIFDPEEHHDHMICQDCGGVSEFHNEQIEKIQVDVANERGFKVVSHRHELYGVCQDCQ
ncbi:MAG: Fur family transcriptional regulator [Oligoflexales bacterium]